MPSDMLPVDQTQLSPNTAYAQKAGLIANPTGQQPPPPNMVQPLPLLFLDRAENYVCTLVNHHMHRADGKRLFFNNGHLETTDYHDVNYLNNEINTGNPFIRKATPLEVDAYHMTVDPRGTMLRQMTPDIEAKVRAELEVELRQEYEKRLAEAGVILTDEQKEKFEATEAMEATNVEVPFGTTDAQKLASADALARVRSRLSGGVASGSGTVYPMGDVTSSTLLQGSISGSDKTTTGVAASDAAAAAEKSDTPPKSPILDTL